MAARYCTLLPVSKYAYYNPAQKDADGNVVVQQPILWILYTISCFSAINFCIAASFVKMWLLLLLTGLFVAGVIIYFVCFFKRKKMIINEKGITLDGTTYNWDDYITSRMFYYLSHDNPKSPYYGVVLIKANGSYACIDIRKFYHARVATPIRDLQPASYKTVH